MKSVLLSVFEYDFTCFRSIVCRREKQLKLRPCVLPYKNILWSAIENPFYGRLQKIGPIGFSFFYGCLQLFLWLYHWLAIKVFSFFYGQLKNFSMAFFSRCAIDVYRDSFGFFSQQAIDFSLASLASRLQLSIDFPLVSLASRLQIFLWLLQPSIAFCMVF